jgi:pimeloyl-ACP methyl ester carboxylesterase
LVGQSQGAHAAFASAGYQPEYAPGLNIRATVLTGTPYFERGITATDILSPTYGGKFQIAGDPKIPYIFYIYLLPPIKTRNLILLTIFRIKLCPYLKMQANYALCAK